MSKMLKELSSIVRNAEDRDEEIEEKMREAAYQLLNRQFLYRHKPRHRKHYEQVLAYQDYFISLMDAMNYELVIVEERGYIGVLPRSFAHRMSLSSTLLLLAMRFIYDQELNAFNAEDDGSVQITLEDFDVRCQQFTKREVAKTLSDFRHQLEPFVRIGVVELGPDENRPEIERVKINPSIAALLSGDMLKRVEVYMRAEDIDTQGASDDDESEELS